MQRIRFIQKKSISEEVEAIVENVVRKSGTGASVSVPRIFLDKKAIVGILSKKARKKIDLNICDECKKPMFTNTKEDAIRRSKDKEFDNKFCQCWRKEKI